MVHLPVLTEVSVTDYGLYVGTREQPGLHHTFESGVNIIVGINGLGKTTLLNILLRALTGPSDSPQGEMLGDKKRRLVPADRSWFRRRVPDDAVNAKVRVTFYVGEKYFVAERSLANLDLLNLFIDQQKVEGSKPVDLEAAYQLAVAAAAGLSSFDDFVFLLRYVVFFLEDRRTLVWDAAAQGDILGILFGEESGDRKRYVEVYNDLLSSDSEYRNLHAVLSKRERELAKQNSTIEGGQIEMLTKQVEAMRGKIEDLTKRKAQLAEERDSLRQQIENRRSDIHDMRAGVATDINKFYESFFPQVNDAGRYLLSHFEAHAGCLVCNTNTPDAIARVNAKLVMNTCPVCESAIEKSGESAHDPHAGESIERRREEITLLEAQLESMIEPLRQAEADHAQVLAELVSSTSEHDGLEQQLDAIGRSLPNAVKKREEIASRLTAFRETLNQIELERTTLAKEFGELATRIDEQVKLVSKKIEASFAKFISGFLAEHCTIAYTARQSRVGQRTQTESFPFPHFVPALTSGVHRASATPREQGQSVSESQKEFIDLAFRMALLEVAAPDSPSMIILETPEASLDSVFVPRAADLLRRFAMRTGASSQTRLIASSNINREQMIPALFGAYPDERFHDQVVDEATVPSPPRVPMEDRHRHVLDLLKIAAPTRALERFRGPYEEEREHALYPERYSKAGVAE